MSFAEEVKAAIERRQALADALKAEAERIAREQEEEKHGTGTADHSGR